MWKINELSPQAIANKLYPLLAKQRFDAIVEQALYQFLHRLLAEQAHEVIQSDLWQQIKQLLLNDTAETQALGAQLLDSQFEVHIAPKLLDLLHSHAFSDLQKILEQVAGAMQIENNLEAELQSIAAEIKAIQRKRKTTKLARQTQALDRQLQHLKEQQASLQYHHDNTDDAVYDYAMSIGLTFIALKKAKWRS
jgi:hypothetical protein